MKVHEILESVYVSTNVELQQEFSLFKQATTGAVQSLINAERSIFKTVAYVKLILYVLAVKLRILPEPLGALEQQKAFLDASAKKAAEAAEATRAANIQPVPAAPQVVPNGPA